LAYGTNGMCATSHPAATLAAVEMLKEGGNAMDAAVTAAGVLAVTEPHMTGIGGDCFAIVWTDRHGLDGFNGSGRSPAGLDPAPFLGSGEPHLPVTSPHAVTVPGAIDAWSQLLDKYGSRGFDRVLAPAIELAENGHPIAPRVAWDWSVLEDKLRKHPGASKHLLKGGRAPLEGEVMRFPALAATLKAIAKSGRKAFYEGAIAEDIVTTLRDLGGAHTSEDFASHRGQWVQPISANFCGHEIAEIPPNGSGVTALIILKILERLPERGTEPMSALRFHALLETARLAYAVRDAFVADPEHEDVPIDHMLSDALAEELAERIDLSQRKPDLGPVPQPKSSDTVYLTVVDRDGMAVSFINSLFWSFGSGIVSEKSGVTLQNRGCGFNLIAGHPNALAPGRRPLHTIIPSMVLAGGRPVMSFGVMGGQYQPVGQASVLTNMLDYGMDPQQALDLPRIFFEADGLALELGVPQAVEDELIAMKHATRRQADPFGGGQIIVIDREAGVLKGASDPRKDGIALGF
jgi:gamma-glutamyltranspeptidase/glutathione hydrolase